MGYIPKSFTQNKKPLQTEAAFEFRHEPECGRAVAGFDLGVGSHGPWQHAQLASGCFYQGIICLGDFPRVFM